MIPLTSEQIVDEAKGWVSSQAATLLVGKLWSYLNCSIDELVARSRFPRSAKTLWRLLQGRDLWTEAYITPLLALAASVWRVPFGELGKSLSQVQLGTPQIEENLCSQFCHMTPRVLTELNQRIEYHERVTSRWQYVGQILPFCLLPERPLRRLAGHLCDECGIANRLAESWVTFGQAWRDNFMNSQARPDRTLLTFDSAFQDIREGRPPYRAFNAEDRADLLLSIAHDAVLERQLRIGLLDGCGSTSMALLNSFPLVISQCAMADGFLIKHVATEPLMRTIDRSAGRRQSQVLDRFRLGLQRLLDVNGGPMDIMTSFKFVLSFLD